MIHTTSPLVPEPSAFEVEMDIEKFKDTNCQLSDQISTELIKAGGRTLHFEIHKIILLGIRSLSSGRSRSLYRFIRRVLKKIVAIIEACHLYTTYKILANVLSWLTPFAEEIIGYHQCGF